MALQGTLDTFTLPDVLRLLATTSKTGRLRIDGDRGRGSVWLSDGALVDADADRTLEGTPLEEVVFELLRFASGSFAFDGDDTASDAGPPEDVEAVLRRADGLLSEWEELEAVVPSLEHEVTLSSDLSADEVTIDADHWRSVVAVSSGRTVGELASALGLTELGISREVRELVDLGIVEVSRAASPAPVRPAPARPAVDDLPRRPPARADADSRSASAIPPVGHPQRAGWLAGDRTGEIPVTSGGDGGAIPAPEPAPRLDDPASSPPPAPPAPRLEDPTPAPAPPAPAPAKGGLTSRLGRNRNGGARADATGPDTVPPVNGARTPRRTPESPSPTNDRGPSSRRPEAEPPSRPGPVPAATRGKGRATPPPAAPAAPGSPFDAGRLGPPPAGRDTGQIRPVSPSTLPPDLRWAADDGPGGPTNGTPTSPFAGLSSLGPGRSGPGDGEVAAHVVAMSPEARSAVQNTVGPAGGSQGARGGSQGEEIAQRGRLISFLSSVR